jgi:hypothetical protein
MAERSKAQSGSPGGGSNFFTVKAEFGVLSFPIPILYFNFHFGFKITFRRYFSDFYNHRHAFRQSNFLGKDRTNDFY